MIAQTNWNNKTGDNGRSMTEIKSSTDQVFEAAVELHNMEQLITRNTIKSLLGDDLSMSVIDERLKKLVAEELLIRVQRGVYVPASTHPAKRIISVTEMPDGMVIIDVGDSVLKLTPSEVRTLGVLLGGRWVQASCIGIEQQTIAISNELASRVRDMERKFHQISKRNRSKKLIDSGQMSIL